MSEEKKTDYCDYYHHNQCDCIGGHCLERVNEPNDYGLFEYMAEQHDVILLESEIKEIKHHVLQDFKTYLEERVKELDGHNKKIIENGGFNIQREAYNSNRKRIIELKQALEKLKE